MTEDRSSLRPGLAERLRTRPVLYPTTLLVGLTLHLFVVSGVSPFAVVRTLLGAILVGLAVTWLATAVAGDRHRGGLVALLLLAASIATAKPLASLPILALAGLVAVGPALRPRLSEAVRWSRYTSWLGRGVAILGLAVALEAFQLQALATLGWSLSEEIRGDVVDMKVAGPAPVYPDIYVLLLDGYARADILESKFDFDNQPFLEALRDRGFEVSERSRSNYLVTWDSVPSFLNMRLDPARTLAADAVEAGLPRGAIVRRLVNDSVAVRLLLAYGYETVMIGSGFEQTAMRGADRFIDTGQLNEFEIQALRFSGLGRLLTAVIPDAVSGQQRDRIFDSFAAVEGLAAETRRGPRFVFAHISSPHAPWVYRGDGSPVARADLDTFYWDVPELTGMTEDEIIDGYREATAYTNTLTLRAVDRILAGSAVPPVVLILSDHGSSFGVGPTNIGDRVRNLFAAYTPDQSGLFAPDQTLVNVLPVVLNTYLGTSVRRSPDAAFAAVSEGMFQYVEVPLRDDD